MWVNIWDDVVGGGLQMWLRAGSRSRSAAANVA